MRIFNEGLGVKSPGTQQHSKGRIYVLDEIVLALLKHSGQFVLESCKHALPKSFERATGTRGINFILTLSICIM
jgi:hypothetical protein